MDCGTVTTKLVGIEPAYPDIEHLTATRELKVHATKPSHIDSYPLVFESCITYKGLPYACRNSTIFKIEI